MWSDLSRANHHLAKWRKLIGNGEKITGRCLGMNLHSVFNAVMAMVISESRKEQNLSALCLFSPWRVLRAWFDFFYDTVISLL